MSLNFLPKSIKIVEELDWTQGGETRFVYTFIHVILFWIEFECDTLYFIFICCIYQTLYFNHIRQWINYNLYCLVIKNNHSMLYFIAFFDEKFIILSIPLIHLNRHEWYFCFERYRWKFKICEKLHLVHTLAEFLIKYAH